MPRGEAYNRARRDRSRAAIVDAATHAFAAKGFHGASTAQVAAAAGVSKALVYAYFPTKDDLLYAVLRARLAALADTLSTVDGTGPVERVHRLLTHAMHHATGYRLWFTMLLHEDMQPVLTRAETELADDLARARDALRTLLPAGASPADVRFAYTTLNGAILAMLTDPAGFDTGAFAERLATAFRSLGTPPSG